MLGDKIRQTFKMNDKINPGLLHTTDAGVIRIKRNLGLAPSDDVMDWVRIAISNAPNDKIMRRGKNIYVNGQNFTITINAHSNTVITAHRNK